MAKATLPHAAYFDTSVLVAAGPELNNQSIPEMLAAQDHSGVRLIIPELVIHEWGWLMHKKYQQAKETFLRDLKQLDPCLVHEDSDFRFKTKEDLADSVAAYFDLVRNGGFEVIPTSDKISLLQLIDEAVRHIAPFDERDTGFRDTIILESISHHAQASFQDPDILVITRDAGMKRGVGRIRRANMRGKIVFPEEAIKEIESRKDKYLNELLEKGEPEALAFLENHKQLIFSSVLSAEIAIPSWGVSLTPFESFGLGLTSVRRINSVHPLEIQRPLPRFAPLMSEQLEPGRTALTFSVLAELNVTVSYTPSDSQTIKLGQPADLTSMRPLLRSVETDLTILRDISVEASVIRTEGDKPTYRDLRIERVYDIGRGSDDEHAGGFFASLSKLTKS